MKSRRLWVANVVLKFEFSIVILMLFFIVSSCKDRHDYLSSGVDETPDIPNIVSDIYLPDTASTVSLKPTTKELLEALNLMDSTQYVHFANSCKVSFYEYSNANKFSAKDIGWIQVCSKLNYELSRLRIATEMKLEVLRVKHESQHILGKNTRKPTADSISKDNKGFPKLYNPKAQRFATDFIDIFTAPVFLGDTINSQLLSYPLQDTNLMYSGYWNARYFMMVGKPTKAISILNSTLKEEMRPFMKIQGDKFVFDKSQIQWLTLETPYLLDQLSKAYLYGGNKTAAEQICKYTKDLTRMNFRNGIDTNDLECGLAFSIEANISSGNSKYFSELVDDFGKPWMFSSKKYRFIIHLLESESALVGGDSSYSTEVRVKACDEWSELGLMPNQDCLTFDVRRGFIELLLFSFDN